MITLQEYKDRTPDKHDLSGIVDELQKSSVLMDSLEWDDTVTAAGDSFPYVYYRKTTESTAAFRKVGENYTPSDAKVTKANAEVKILGGTYTIDRAIAKASKDKFIDEVELQSSEKVKAVKATFSDAMINGDAAENDKEFDGLDKILTASDTEFTSTVDLSTSKLVDTNYTALIDEMDGVIGEMIREPEFIASNSKAIGKIKAVARRAGQYTESKDDFGRTVSKYGNAVLLDLGSKPGSSDPIVGIDGEGKTDIYFICLGKDAVHGITLNNQLMDVVTPDFNSEAATSANGLVEFYGAIVLKNTKGAAVLRGVKVK